MTRSDQRVVDLREPHRFNVGAAAMPDATGHVAAPWNVVRHSTRNG